MELVALTTPAPSTAQYVDGYCYGTPLRFALVDRGDLDGAAGVLRERMTERWGEGPIEQDMSALLVAAL